jgi:hypothetical protein
MRVFGFGTRLADSGFGFNFLHYCSLERRAAFKTPGEATTVVTNTFTAIPSLFRGYGSTDFNTFSSPENVIFVRW